MERRNFIKVLAAVPFFGAALARKCESKELANWPAGPVDLKWDAQRKVWSGGPHQVIMPTIAEIDLNENRYYDPKWNVNGSWNKAQSRVGLISHLAGANHKFDKSYLNTLSTDQLQKLHDDDHNKKRRTTTRRRWFR